MYLHTVPDERQLPRHGSAVRHPPEHHPSQHCCASQQRDIGQRWQNGTEVTSRLVKTKPKVPSWLGMLIWWTILQFFFEKLHWFFFFFGGGGGGFNYTWLEDLTRTVYLLIVSYLTNERSDGLEPSRSDGHSSCLITLFILILCFFSSPETFCITF